jgi:hypothetical protein
MTRNTGRVRIFRVAITCAIVLGVGAADAAAQGQGVTVDPESPSGKQYAIPLESARRQADPQSVRPTGPSGAGSAALFGEGVVVAGRIKGQSRDGSGARQPGGKAPRGTASNPSPASPRDVPVVVSIAASRPAAPDGGIGMPVLVLGLGLLVVLIGAAAGVVIRRRSDA